MKYLVKLIFASSLLAPCAGTAQSVTVGGRNTVEVGRQQNPDGQQPRDTPGDTERPEIFTLQDCIRIGLENNYSIRIARNAERIAANNATRGNAGQLPTLDLGAAFSGTSYDYEDRMPGREPDASYNQTLNYVDLGATLGWTIFSGFDLSAGYERLKELSALGELGARMVLEDFVASVCAGYYTLIRQQTRLSNLRATVTLSDERLRIVEASFRIGAASGLDYQQAQVDYNADNSDLIAQQELVNGLQITLNELMGLADVDAPVSIADSEIYPDVSLDRESIWQCVMAENTSLRIAERNSAVSKLDLRRAQSRNYPYLRVSAGYGYRHSWDNYSPYDAQKQLGLTYGVSMGMTIFDGMNRRREQRNARLEIENRRLESEQLELSLRSDMASLWLAYDNNLKLLDIEEENLVVARNNFDIAMERYRLRELSGIELREAQLSLLQSEERLSTVKYNIKMCEVSFYLLSGKIAEMTERLFNCARR